MRMLPMMAVMMPMREDHSRNLEPVSLSSCKGFADIETV